MPEPNRAFALEQAGIEKILDARVSELPAGARPAAGRLLASESLRFRGLLTVFTGRASGCRDDSLFTLGAAVELVHLASLMHRDTAAEARPEPVPVFPPIPLDQSILSGDAMLAKALRMFASLGDNRLINCISDAMLGTFAAGIAEMEALKNADLSREGYLAIVAGKTAGLTRASCELGALRAGASGELCRAATDFGSALGLGSQIERDAGAEAGLIRAVREHGFRDKAREMALDYAAKAGKALERFPESADRDSLRQLLELAVQGL